MFRRVKYILVILVLYVLIFLLFSLNDETISKQKQPIVFRENINFKNTISEQAMLLDVLQEPAGRKKTSRLLNENDENTPIPVYVVEEHHEVVPYWFQAVREGRIGAYGNILVHIDGHSDFASPTYPRNASIFRHPRMKSELKYKMKTNDGFIMSSAYSGFLSRIIWIYPSWDTDRLERGHHNIGMYAFGYVRGRTHLSEWPMCECFESFSPSERIECKMLEGNDDEHRPLHVSQCDIKQVILVEVLSDSRAAMLIKSTDWLSSTDNVYFDIDEDYYGCQAAIQPLLDVKIPEHTIDEIIAPIVKILFCARSGADELALDAVNYQLLNQLSTILASDNITPANKKKDLITETIDHIASRNLTELLCNNERVNDIMDMYISALSELNTKQLNALAETGICLAFSPNQYDFNPMGEGMRVCDGYNSPSNTVVPFFTPSLEEITERTQQLQTIFNNLPTPRLVTICRSARDGYTPRKQVLTIENDIIATLMRVHPQIISNSIYYDSNLLGGKNSWYSRHGNKVW